MRVRGDCMRVDWAGQQAHYLTSSLTLELALRGGDAEQYGTKRSAREERRFGSPYSLRSSTIEAKPGAPLVGNWFFFFLLP